MSPARAVPSDGRRLAAAGSTGPDKGAFSAKRFETKIEQGPASRQENVDPSQRRLDATPACGRRRPLLYHSRQIDHQKGETPGSYQNSRILTRAFFAGNAGLLRDWHTIP